MPTALEKDKNQNQRVLVTGGTGLVGSFIVRKFLQEGYPVRVLVRPTSDRALLQKPEDRPEWAVGDVLDVPSLEAAVAGCRYVVHAAGVVSFHGADASLLTRGNVRGTANVVNACLYAATPKLCHISSVAALGRSAARSPGLQWIDESQLWEDSPLNNRYAVSKYEAELEVWRGMAEGLEAVIVNPSVVLGEGLRERGSSALIAYGLQERTFYSNGSLNYIDAADVAEAVFRLTVGAFSGERYILNAGRISYRSFFEKIAALGGKRPPTRAVTPLLAEAAWRWEALKAFITGKKPLVTKETARTSLLEFGYQNEKVQKATGMVFRPLEETLQRVIENWQTEDVKIRP